MLKLAYGEMGLSTEELAGLTPFQFMFKIEGYRKRQRTEENNFRRLAEFVIAPHRDPKSNLNIFDLWPIEGDPEQKAQQHKKKLTDNVKVSAMLKAYRDKLKK